MAQKVFISHAHADKALARECYLALTRAGFNVFIDDLGLRPSQNLRVELERHLNDSNVFALLWSQHCNREWVLWELKQALARAITSGLRIVIIALDDSERPEEIKHHLYIDLTTSLRRGLAQLSLHLTDPAARIVPVDPRGEFYRPDMDEVSWFLTSQPEHVRDRNWKLVIGDSGLMNILAERYAIPPQSSALLLDGPIEDVRRAYLHNAERLLEFGESLATCMLQELVGAACYSAHPEMLPLEACRRHLAWVMAVGAKLASKWLTTVEFDRLEDGLTTRLQSLSALLDEMDSSGLARSYGSDDPIDLLFGTEVPLDPDNFVAADLVFGPDHERAAGIGHVLLHLPKSRNAMGLWAERLLDSQWPPPARLLDNQGWALVFVPQIARELTLSLWKGRSPVKPDELGFAFDRNAYMLLGPH
jgi:hypothetical protein